MMMLTQHSSSYMWCTFKCVYCVAAAPLLKPGDNGVAVDGDHETVGAQDLEKAENEDNNAGEKGDGQY
jgi:wyosine [tRNA(Phe)-imidazoG37] synthetase (radical SAM superfamily)